MEINRRKFLTSTVAGSSLLLAGCMNNTQSYGEGHEVPDGPIANASIPSSPEDRVYATMGSDDASVAVQYFGNFKCPYCAQFSVEILPGLVEDYVAPRDVQLQYRSLVYVNGQAFLGQDSPRLGQGGLAVWNNDPEQYWTFHEYVYANQPPESENWGTVNNIMNFVEGSNVENTEQIKEDINNNAYNEPLQQTAEAANSADITGTPLLWINGTVVNGLEEQQVRNVIESSI